MRRPDTPPRSLPGRAPPLVALLLMAAACHPKSPGASSPDPCVTSALLGCEPAQPAAPRGLADYHVHQMAGAAFGGAWIWGAEDGPPAQALAPCSGHGFDHGLIAAPEGGPANLGRHDPGGYPDFEGWPRFNTISHQQAYSAWLREAHDQGLDLMVMSAVEQTDFCELIPASTRRYTCDDFASVKRQIQMAWDFERAHADWYKIVLSPAEARAAIAEGKLAVVLAVEAGDLFDGAGSVVGRLTELRSLGVRALQPVHETDNRFAGAAWHDPPLLTLQLSHYASHPAERRAQRALKRAQPCTLGAGCMNHIAGLAGFALDAEGRNLRGLSDAGRALVQAMIDREMILDISHLSERAIADSFEISKDHHYYPLFVSHAHFSDVEPEEIGEWSYSLSIVSSILETGGVLGLRSSSSLSPTVAGSGVVNDCDGSSKSFAQRLSWVTRSLGLQVGFASDFGGLATNLAPRFGEDACADAHDGVRGAQRAAQRGASGLRIDQRGFAHIGMLGEVIAELRSVGADTAPLYQGAESFIRMWERIEDPKRARLDRSFDPEAARAALR